MRFPAESVWGANAGLGCARDFLEPIKVRCPSQVTTSGGTTH